MAVELIITWGSEESEIIPVASQQEYQTTWAAIAKEKSLEHIGHQLPIILEPGNIATIAEEVQKLEKALLSRAETDEKKKVVGEKMRLLVDALRRLQSGRKWLDASIG